MLSLPLTSSFIVLVPIAVLLFPRASFNIDSLPNAMLPIPLMFPVDIAECPIPTLLAPDVAKVPTLFPINTLPVPEVKEAPTRLPIDIQSVCAIALCPIIMERVVPPEFIPPV